VVIVRGGEPRLEHNHPKTTANANGVEQKSWIFSPGVKPAKSRGTFVRHFSAHALLKSMPMSGVDRGPADLAGRSGTEPSRKANYFGNGLAILFDKRI
jgi:hypothetical protein